MNIGNADNLIRKDAVFHQRWITFEYFRFGNIIFLGNLCQSFSEFHHVHNVLRRLWRRLIRTGFLSHHTQRQQKPSDEQYSFSAHTNLLNDKNLIFHGVQFGYFSTTVYS